MKKVILISSIFLFAIIFAGCKKSGDSTPPDYKCASCKSTPDALAVNDGSSKGVYKGIVIGSTGTIQFNIQNGSSTITATMVLDGTTVNLTSSVNWVAGVSYVAPFTGTLNGAAITITFKVDPNGANPMITSSNIPGHPSAQFNLAKESSVALIECFEGTYETTKPEKGTFNLIVSRFLKKMGGSSRQSNGTTNGDFSGTITSDGKLMQNGTDYIGTLSGEVVSGSFKDNDGKTVTVKGKRTL
ncbi:MAG: hypothetical protein JSS98_08580 [Bacteroidetes bacterium]|nr:hypothetical protein [Bacteroidota bacterium]